MTEVEASLGVHRTTFGLWTAPGFRADDSGRRTPDAVMLNASRYRLRELSVEEGMLFDQVCERSVPGELRDTKVMEAGMESWRHWLGNIASDIQLVDYLQWHVGSIADQQRDPTIREEIAAQRSEHEAGLRRGVLEGWLHEDTDITAAAGAKIYIGDVFGTTLKEILAYCMSEKDEVVFGGATSIPEPGEYSSVRALIEDVAQHEFNHLMGRLAPRWLKEAVTDHTAQVIRYAELEVVDPEKRTVVSGYYPGERGLLSFILNEGREIVPAKLATRAYSEPSGKTEAGRLFRKSVDRAWNYMVPGSGSAYDQLNQRASRLEGYYRAQGLPSIKAGKRAMARMRRDMTIQPEILFQDFRAPSAAA